MSSRCSARTRACRSLGSTATSSASTIWSASSGELTRSTTAPPPQAVLRESPPTSSPASPAAFAPWVAAGGAVLSVVLGTQAAARSAAFAAWVAAGSAVLLCGLAAARNGAAVSMHVVAIGAIQRGTASHATAVFGRARRLVQRCGREAVPAWDTGGGRQVLLKRGGDRPGGCADAAVAAAASTAVAAAAASTAVAAAANTAAGGAAEPSGLERLPRAGWQAASIPAVRAVVARRRAALAAYAATGAAIARRAAA
eukprot:363957-Chlamydomonas_euryale.AAC.11